MLYCLLAFVTASVVYAQDFQDTVCFACEVNGAVDQCALSNGVCLEDPTNTGYGYCRYNDDNSCGLDEMYMEGCCERDTSVGDYYTTRRCVPVALMLSFCADLTDDPVCAEDRDNGHFTTFDNRNKALCEGYCDSRIISGECLNETESTTPMPDTTDDRYDADVCSECYYTSGTSSNSEQGCETDNSDCYALRTDSDGSSGATLHFGYCVRDDICTPDTSSHSSDCTAVYGNDRPYCMTIRCCGHWIGATTDRVTTRCVSDPVYYTDYTTCDFTTEDPTSTDEPDTTEEHSTDIPDSTDDSYDPPICDKCGRYANTNTYWGCDSDGVTASNDCEKYYSDGDTNEERGYCIVDECDVDNDCTHFGRPLCREIYCCGRDPLTYELVKTRVNRRCVSADIADIYAGCDDLDSTEEPDTSDMPETSTTDDCSHSSEYDPVCGSDGATYSNIGALECAKLLDSSLEKHCIGECPCESTTIEPTSTDDDCSYTTEWDPICGSDGVTYTNAGHLECAKLDDSTLDEDCDGECPCSVSSSTEDPTTTDYDVCVCDSTSLDFGCDSYYASFEAKIVVRSDDTSSKRLCDYLHWYKRALHERFEDFCWQNIYIDTNCDSLSDDDLVSGQIGSVVVYIAGRFCNKDAYTTALDIIDTIPTECKNELTTDVASVSWLDISFDDSYGWFVQCANDCSDTGYDCLAYTSTGSHSGVIGLHSLSMIGMMLIGVVTAMLF